MPPVRIEFTVPPGTFARIEEARGDVPRATWIKQALETALGAEDHGAPRAVPAPSRTPVKRPSDLARTWAR